MNKVTAVDLNCCAIKPSLGKLCPGMPWPSCRRSSRKFSWQSCRWRRGWGRSSPARTPHNHCHRCTGWGRRWKHLKKSFFPFSHIFTFHSKRGRHVGLSDAAWFAAKLFVGEGIIEVGHGRPVHVEKSPGWKYQCNPQTMHPSMKWFIFGPQFACLRLTLDTNQFYHLHMHHLTARQTIPSIKSNWRRYRLHLRNKIVLDMPSVFCFWYLFKYHQRITKVCRICVGLSYPCSRQSWSLHRKHLWDPESTLSYYVHL